MLANARGKPVVVLHGRARARANRLDIGRVEVSMTHERSMACAFAIALGNISTGEPPAGGDSGESVA